MNENRSAYRVVTHRQIRLIGKMGEEDDEDRSIQRAALVRTPVGLCRKHKNREYYFERIKSEITHIFKADKTVIHENIPSEAWRESSEKG